MAHFAAWIGHAIGRLWVHDTGGEFEDRKPEAWPAAASPAAVVPLFIAYGTRSPGANVVAHKFEWAVAFLLREQGLSHGAGVVLLHLWLPSCVKGFFEGIIAI